MGQQQLLLIILSAIIVGISIVVGINMVTSGAGQANYNAVMQDLMTVGEQARDFYRKPALVDGGGNSFARLAATQDMVDLLGWPAQNENGTYTVSTAGDANSVTFQGLGTEDLDQDGTDVTLQVTAWRDSLTTTVVNR